VRVRACIRLAYPRKWAREGESTNSFADSPAHSKSSAVTPTAGRRVARREVSESRSGWGEALVTSNRGEREPERVSRKRTRSKKRPLTRESSALARRNGTVCAVSHPRAGPALEIGSSAKAERPDSNAGFRRSDGRACGSFRLQKSTSGAWPSAPGREERAEAAWSSPSSSGSGGRRSAGSRTGVAKSRDRWRVSRPRPPRASGVVERGTRRWKASWVALAGAFDEATVNVILAGRVALRRTRLATGASKVVTFGPSTEDNTGDGGCHLAGSHDREPGRIEWHPQPPDRRGRETSRLQLMARRQARRDPSCPLGLCSIGCAQPSESKAVTSGVE